MSAIEPAIDKEHGQRSESTNSPPLLAARRGLRKGVFALERAAGNRAVAALLGGVDHSAGAPLDAGTQHEMDARFGQNFGEVRVHTDNAADASTRSLHAAAYTIGHDIVFAAGRYNPRTAGGRRLLAHELAHVVQQRRGSGGHSPISTLEANAERAAQALTSQPGTVAVAGASGPAIQMQEAGVGAQVEAHAGETEKGGPVTGQSNRDRAVALIEEVAKQIGITVAEQIVGKGPIVLIRLENAAIEGTMQAFDYVKGEISATQERDQNLSGRLEEGMQEERAKDAVLRLRAWQAQGVGGAFVIITQSAFSVLKKAGELIAEEIGVKISEALLHRLAKAIGKAGEHEHEASKVLEVVREAFVKAATAMGYELGTEALTTEGRKGDAQAGDAQQVPEPAVEFDQFWPNVVVKVERGLAKNPYKRDRVARLQEELRTLVERLVKERDAFRGKHFWQSKTAFRDQIATDLYEAARVLQSLSIALMPEVFFTEELAALRALAHEVGITSLAPGTALAE